MGQIAFSVTKTGLAVPVFIGLSGETTTKRAEAGQPILAPLQVRGLLDTACDLTAVAPSVLRQLGIGATSTVETHTASGPVKVNVYKVSLGITDAGRQQGVWLTLPDLIVTELATELPQVDVLIGLDVLLQCRLLLDGPARQFTLEFQE